MSRAYDQAFGEAGQPRDLMGPSDGPAVLAPWVRVLDAQDAQAIEEVTPDKVTFVAGASVGAESFQRMDILASHEPGNVFLRRVVAVHDRGARIEVETMPAEAPRPNTRLKAIEGALDDSGTLRATITHTYQGVYASYIRRVLRQRTEETQRQKLAESFANAELPGLSVTGYEFEGIEDLDAPIRVRIQIEKPQFALPHQGGLRVEWPIMQDDIAKTYAALPSRTLPLMISFQYSRRGDVRITLPKTKGAVEIRSQQGSWERDSAFGRATRSVRVEGDTLIIESSFEMEPQRIAPAQYGDFQKWATAVEQDGLLAIDL